MGMYACSNFKTWVMQLGMRRYCNNIGCVRYLICKAFIMLYYMVLDWARNFKMRCMQLVVRPYCNNIGCVRYLTCKTFVMLYYMVLEWTSNFKT